MPKTLYLDFGESLARLRSYIDNYNESFQTGATVDGKPTYNLNKKLRGQHRDLMQFIIRTYAKDLNGQIAGATAIRPFRTNSVALGKAMDCSPRTIRNLTDRLIEARLILEKHHRGRKRCYDLVINPAVYVVYGFEEKTVPIEHLVCIEISSPEEPNDTFMRKTLPELNTGSKENKNNQTCGQVENESQDIQSDKRAHLSGSTRKQSALRKAPSAANDTRKQRGMVRATCSHRGGAAFPDALRFEDRKRFEEYAIRLRGLIHATLYKRLDFIAGTQAKAIRSFIEREFSGQAPSEYESIYQGLRTRIMLAHDFVERDPAKRFIPLPSRYFNPQNFKGFAGTKRWLENMRNETKRKQEYSLRYRALMKGWGALMTQVGNFVAKPDLETYMQGRSILGSKYFAMLEAYDYVTLDHQQALRN